MSTELIKMDSILDKFEKEIFARIDIEKINLWLGKLKVVISESDWLWKIGKLNIVLFI